MHRRGVLEGVGAAALSLAGCLYGDLSGRSTDERSRSGAAPPTTAMRTDTTGRRHAVGTTVKFADGSVLRVSSPTVQRSIVTDPKAVLTVEERAPYQFVVVDVGGTRDISAAAFGLRRDGAIVSPGDGSRGFFVHGVTRECPGVCVGLPFVTGATSSAAVVYHPDDRVLAEWRLPHETVARFVDRPLCTLREAVLTDHDGSVAVRFTIDNIGTLPAGFRAIVTPAWQEYVADPVGFRAPAGETVTETVVPPSLADLAPGDAMFTQEVTENTRVFEVERTGTPARRGG